MRDNQGWDLRKAREILSCFSLQEITEISHSEWWLSLEDDRESQGTLQGSMFHLATSQTCHTYQGQPYEKRCQICSRHKLDYAKEHQRGSSLLEQRWESVGTRDTGRDGRLSQPAFGGLYGWKGTRDVLKTRVTLCRNSR
ncbi:hypothetical protein H5410_045815 [Solanum commersonii]|uniref:Uncharacterized protein n=1 Tax=Solanum commersonii TaxID=4109 RepID=A0A9J5XCN0_SOLCO|nr:hypothetical protein H5410_045815 [Solanum commersonii]